jgi:hypothetical protein
MCITHVSIGIIANVVIPSTRLPTETLGKAPLSTFSRVRDDNTKNYSYASASMGSFCAALNAG